MPAETNPPLYPDNSNAALLLGLVLAAPLVSWAAHAMLGSRLDPASWSGTVRGSMAWLWVLAVAPVVEETILRSLLQPGLQHELRRVRLAKPFPLGKQLPGHGHIANLLTALVFALLHWPAYGAMALWWVIPSLAIGEVWRRNSSWYQCVLLHAWFNVSLLGVTAWAER